MIFATETIISLLTQTSIVKKETDCKSNRFQENNLDYLDAELLAEEAEEVEEAEEAEDPEEAEAALDIIAE